MSAYTYIQKIITRSASVFGFVRRAMHDEEVAERLRMTQFFNEEKEQRLNIVEKFGAEQLAHREAKLFRQHEQTERLRVIKEYLDLLEDCLTGSIYQDPPMQIWDDTKGFNAQTREYGWDWPSQAHTMIGQKRLHNLRLLTETVLMLA